MGRGRKVKERRDLEKEDNVKSDKEVEMRKKGIDFDMEVASVGMV